MTDLCRIYVIVPREHLHLFSQTIDSYENLAIVTTIDGPSGLLQVTCDASCEGTLREVLTGIANEIPWVEAEKPANPRDPFKETAP